jgi:hypothetical protein
MYNPQVLFFFFSKKEPNNNNNKCQAFSSGLAALASK